MHEDNRWKYVIDPKDKRPALQLRELWRYRDLVLLFAKRDFVSQYKQMRLGWLWAVISPVLNTVVFTVVFGSWAGLTTMDVPSTGKTVVPTFLFYMVGNILWSYFSGVVTTVSKTFVRHAGIMGKAYYPRLAAPVSSALSALITEVIRLCLFAVLTLAFVWQGSAAVRPSPLVGLLALMVLQLMLLGLGVGLLVSALSAKYRDVLMLVEFCLRLWFFATPVVYGLRLFGEKWIPLLMLNPVAPIITTARYLCFGEGYFQAQYYLLSCLVSALVFLAGVAAFNRAGTSFVDTF